MPPSLALDDQLCFAAYTASHAFTRFYKALLTPLGLTYPQYLVLLALWPRDGQSVRAIGAQLHLDSGTLTPLLKRMQAAGLLRRARDPNDERQVLVSLTPKARALEARAATFPARIGAAAHCSGAELGALRDALFALSADLDAAA